jgi:Rps23 Pro-64 3,4-dihydroxylase Tpa1-like proline 4-hydroxylase
MQTLKYLSSNIQFDQFVSEWANKKPFSHIIIDNFLNNEVAQQVAKEFPNFEDHSWKIYNNAIEVKKLINHWDKFGPYTYQLFQYLNSQEFIEKIEPLTGCKLFPDFGLNGGGLHSHKCGGKLNTHLDYSIHPKLKLERRINLLIYVTPNWEESWGGALGLWDQAPNNNAPGSLQKIIFPLFNRAVLFDTTQNSWHGLPEPIKCPIKITRNSLAVYYLCEPREGAIERGKALFAPYGDQINNPEVLSLIEKRSQITTASDVYGDK